MPERAEFFEEFGQIPSKEFGLVLMRRRGFGRGSLRREYFFQEDVP